MLGMTGGWRRLDNRTEPVASRRMMFELPGRLVILAMLEVGSMLAQRVHRCCSQHARHSVPSNRGPAS